MDQTDVYLSIGSSLEPETNLPRALGLLRARYDVVAWSSAYKSRGEGSGAGNVFLNAAAILRTQLEPAVLKRELRTLEAELGRTRRPGDAPGKHPIDLDIALWGDAQMEYGEKPWRVPDPAVFSAAYVAVPLAEIAADFCVPGDGRSLGEIAKVIGDDSLVRISLDWGKS